LESEHEGAGWAPDEYMLSRSRGCFFTFLDGSFYFDCGGGAGGGVGERENGARRL